MHKFLLAASAAALALSSADQARVKLAKTPDEAADLAKHKPSAARSVLSKAPTQPSHLGPPTAPTPPPAAHQTRQRRAPRLGHADRVHPHGDGSRQSAEHHGADFHRARVRLVHSCIPTARRRCARSITHPAGIP